MQKFIVFRTLPMSVFAVDGGFEGIEEGEVKKAESGEFEIADASRSCSANNAS